MLIIAAAQGKSDVWVIGSDGQRAKIVDGDVIPRLVTAGLAKDLGAIPESELLAFPIRAGSHP